MAFGSGVAEGCHTVVEVGRSVGADGRRGTHGAHEDDGLVAVYGQRKEVGGLLHGVGAVGDEHAVVAFGIEKLVDALGQFEPNLVVHVLRTDVDELLTAHFCQLFHLRYGVDEGLNADLSGRIG